MKVLHVITESNLGGAQRNTLLTIRGLVRQGYEVHLACGPYGPGDATALIREAQACGVTVRIIPELIRPICPRKDIAAALAIARLLRREKYDVVHTHSTKAGMIGRVIAWLCRVPVIVHTFHGVPFDTRSENWKTRLCFLAERFFCLFCHRLVSVGEVLRGELIEHGVARAEKVVTVHSGVDFSSLNPGTDARAVRRALGLPDDAKVVGFVGRLAEQKAPEVLVRAFALVKPRVPEAHLLMVGEGPLHEQLENMIRELKLDGEGRTQGSPLRPIEHDKPGERSGSPIRPVEHDKPGEHNGSPIRCVHLLGERTDVPDLLAAMDVFALPSRWEGVGRALTEAMYMKLPVVTTGVNGVPELVRDRVTGLTIRGDDPADAADKITEVLRNRQLAATLGQAGHDRVRTLMSAEAMVDDTIRLYQELASRIPSFETRQGGRRVWDMRQTES